MVPAAGAPAFSVSPPAKAGGWALVGRAVLVEGSASCSGDDRNQTGAKSNGRPGRYRCGLRLPGANTNTVINRVIAAGMPTKTSAVSVADNLNAPRRK